MFALQYERATEWAQRVYEETDGGMIMVAVIGGGVRHPRAGCHVQRDGPTESSAPKN